MVLYEHRNLTRNSGEPPSYRPRSFCTAIKPMNNQSLNLPLIICAVIPSGVCKHAT